MASIFDNGGYVGTSVSYGGLPAVTDGLLLALDAGNPRSYPGSGSTWFDLSGNGNHATLFNSPTWSNTNGGTFTFNGSNQYASVPNTNFFNFTKGVTIFAILNFGTGNSWERIIDFGVTQAQNNILFARNLSSTTLNFEFYNATTIVGQVQTGSGIVNNTIAAYAAIAGSGRIRTYRNLSQIGGATFDSDLPSVISRTNCYIGRSNWAADAYAYFGGTMNVLLIYDRALSEGELAKNFTVYRGRFGL